MPRNYWMVVQTTEDFEISRQMGFTLHGLRFSQRRRAQRMEPKDSLLYYVSGIRQWTAITTVTSSYFEDHSHIWGKNGSTEEFPYRVKLEPALILDENDYIDALQLAPRLEYLKRWAPERWPEAFVDTLHLLPQRDFRLIEGEMKRVHPKWRNRRQSKKVNNRRRRGSHVDGNGPTLLYEPRPRVTTNDLTTQQEQATHLDIDRGDPTDGYDEDSGVTTDTSALEHRTDADIDGAPLIVEHEPCSDPDNYGLEME